VHFQLVCKPIPTSDGTNLYDSDDDDDDDFSGKSGSRKEVTALIDDDQWKAIAQAVDEVDDHLGNDELACLGHPASQVFMFKRNKAGEVITRRLTDTLPLTRHLRLRGAMFSHHMPGGYNTMFDGFGQVEESVCFEVIPVPPKKGKYKGKFEYLLWDTEN
jgi:hypothetical protein